MVGRLKAYIPGRTAFGISPKERLKAFDFLAFESYLAANTSHRASGEIMNIAARRSGTNNNTISMYTEYEDVLRCGKAAEEAALDIARDTLADSGVRTNAECEVIDHTALDGMTSGVPSPMVEVDLNAGLAEGQDGFIEKIASFTKEHNGSQASEGTMLRGTYAFERDTEKVVYLSVDDVLVHRQKTVRKNGVECVSSKWIYHTVVHIESAEGIYVMEASSQRRALSCAMAYLIKNGYTDRYLIFFIDGEETIKDGIKDIFSGWRHTVFIDYYHVTERITELFSGAFKPGKVRDDTVEPEYFKNGKVKKGSIKMMTRSQYYVREFMSMIWFGNVGDALEWLDEIKNSCDIKPGGLSKIDSAITYINNKRDRMTCFAMRKHLGLRNSSNQVEIANNNIVAHRQKRNGLSWNDTGSFACSQMTAVFKNHEAEGFFEKGILSFAPRLKSSANDKSEISWISNSTITRSNIEAA